MSPRKAKASADPAPEIKPFIPLAPSRLPASMPSVSQVAVGAAIPDDGDFVVGSKWEQVRHTNAYEGSCWIFSPARVEFLAEASGAFVTVAEALKMTTEKITKMEVILQRSTKRLFFRPATEDSDSYFDVAETSNDYLSVNIRSLLQSNGLEVKTGYQERYPVSLQIDSPVGPALVVDLTKVEERRRTAERKARQAAKAGKGAKATKAKGTEEAALTATATKAKPSPAPSKGKATSKKAAAPAPEVPAEADADLPTAEVDELDLNEE